ncbi:MAG: tannase/feruloyl esterase family alpha/beta hydrolase [Acidobacteriota bacterium]
MKAMRLSLWLFVALINLTIVTLPVLAQDDCANLAKQKLDNVTIASAVFMDDPEGFELPQTPGMFGTRAGLKTTAHFCRVTGFIQPVENSHIHFEVWLPPADKWNNRYFGVGNPAFEGAIKYQGLQNALEAGFA